MPEVIFYGTGMNLVWKFVKTVIFWGQTDRVRVQKCPLEI
jgi:hypothetical protein